MSTPAYTNIRRIVSEARSATNRNQSVIVNLSDLDALLNQIDSLQKPATEPAPSEEFLRRTRDALCEQVDWSNNEEKTALAIIAAIRERRIPGLYFSVQDRTSGLAALFSEGAASKPVPMIMSCPACGDRHIDEGEFATKVHHTHACLFCGVVWRPAVAPTVGVLFLPGFKNDATKENT